MIRDYLREIGGGLYPKEILVSPARDHAGRMSIRQAAETNGVPYKILAGYVPILKQHKCDIESKSIGNKKNKQVLPIAIENNLNSYCIKQL